MKRLEVTDLHVTVGGKKILNGLSLSIEPGSIHAIMGPNGSGKSTLAAVLAGKPGYQIESGTLLVDGQPINDMAAEDRAHLGVFLAFQYPVEIPGVSNMEFLKAALDSLHAARKLEPLSAMDFMKRVRAIAATLKLDPEFLKRGVNEGFSGGEKKRNEILQLLLLQPRLAVLDETDSGLDIDALQVVARGVNEYHNADNAVLMITHYQRLLDFIVPDQVHVLSAGTIVRSGDKSLALELEEKGYSWLTA
ncbi:MAG: Fe-S cluster assembly ATPase SufC [Pseudomonadales bacterium]